MAVNEGFEMCESGEIENAKCEKREEKPREMWDKDIHFLMSCIAMSVGLGNVWRFPFTAYENGGGAFLIPYLITLVFIGRPMYFLEMCIGQFTSQANLKSFKLMTPASRGIAVTQAILNFFGGSYYCSLLVISLYYLFNSFTTNLPWAECLPEWADDPIGCVPSSHVNVTNYSVESFRSSSDLWFSHEVLKEKNDISDGIGVPDWKLTCYLLFTWVLIFSLSARDIRASGKASYFMALFPYVVLSALFIRAVTLKGSLKGILYFIRPQWDKLLQAKVWFSAITQCFFSLSIGSGSIITYASFNRFEHNIRRDTLIITAVDTLTSIASGVTIFSILGHLANRLNVEVTQVIGSGGARLAFVSYPDAIAKFETVPWLFSIIFFLMLYVLGLGSILAGQTMMYKFFKDVFPVLKRWQTSLLMSLSCFFTGLIYITPGGQFMVTLIDHFGVTFMLFVVAILEVIVFIWWYGLGNFCTDVEFMINKKIGVYWKLCWGFVTPCLLIAVLVHFFVTLKKLKNGAYEFPDSVLGWCLLAFGLSQLWIWWFVLLYNNRHVGIKQLTEITNANCEELEQKEVEETREMWDKDIHFLMSCIAMSVGLGNVWRFPFTAYENGGGAFLIPYLITVILVGRPIYFLEMCFGQFTSKANLKSFELITPASKGIAVTQAIINFLAASYYCSLLVISMFYLFNSFTTNLPWAECSPEWTNDAIACIPSSFVNVTNYSVDSFRSSSELWFEREVLKEKTDIGDGIGVPDWKLTGCLLLSWILLFLLSARGITASGKASYFLALFPYVVLFALFVRAITLEGSLKGILYFIRPQWDKLLKAKVWFNAVTQCFFSLNIGFGSIITYASFNRFENNIYSDTLIITSVDTLTSILSGVTIFSILGHLAHQLNVEVTEVISSGGTRLAFVTYPDAIAKFESVIFHNIFFNVVRSWTRMYTINANSTILIFSAYISERQEMANHFTSGLKLLFCGITVSYPGSQFMLTLIDYFGVTFMVFIMAILEVIVVIWWYGLENFCTDVEFMINKKIGIYWKLCWGFVTPSMLIAVLVYFLSTLEKLKNGVHEFPDFVLVIGWCILAFGLSQLWVWWLILLYQNRRNGIRQAILNSFSVKSWRPREDGTYEKWLNFKLSHLKEKSKSHSNWLQKVENIFLNK
ncbi:hypothetical protein FQR65_LT01801 [Abscondita terminalis]|nr:hypothetical protein FQR65_LT01801 [Abscondita terminalis]